MHPTDDIHIYDAVNVDIDLTKTFHFLLTKHTTINIIDILSNYFFAAANWQAYISTESTISIGSL